MSRYQNTSLGIIFCCLVGFLWLSVGFIPGSRVSADENPDLTTVEKQFRELPMNARRLTGPLFWLHGDESRQRLETYLEKVAEGGNGCFTAESRPHNDWLGPGWYRDLEICLEAAKRLDLKMWIFDERWWPSGEVAGKVPQSYGSKYLEASATDIQGPRELKQNVSSDKVVAVIAGQLNGELTDGTTLVELTDHLRDGQLTWNVPEGVWRVMVFTWRYSEGRRGRLLVDGASREAVDWYVRTVYQPHFDRFADDFGKTIVGYFYDEPETLGDWGTEVIPLLKERGVDWKQALVAWKFALADADSQIAAKYQYQDAFAEAWGRTLYGGLTDWCHRHHVLSIGHFLEHNHEYLQPERCAGNMFQLMKYSDMGAIDAVFRQFIPGRKDDSTYQTPKLGSSISHAYGKHDDLTMVEIFGARGQDLPYPEMKWWTDLMHVAGVNFHIPHSFNPRAPYDLDCPPYFYNSGYEPRWPVYRVYADYTSRLSLMLTGGHHVCPVALLYLGNSFHAGKTIPPEDLTTSLQDALFDCDWIPYDVFEKEMAIEARGLRLRDEQYRVLIVPAAEVLPYETLAKAKQYLDAGGVVVGYGMLPVHSATLGRTSAEMAALREAIWGSADEPGLAACRMNAKGGRSYFLPAKPTAAQLQNVLSADAEIHPTLEVLEGETEGWLHVLHRVKARTDIFFVCNQQPEGPTKRFRLRLHAKGTPECWDALRGEIQSLPHERVGENTVELPLVLEPLESALIVFQPRQTTRPLRIGPELPPTLTPIAVVRDKTPPEAIIPHQPPIREQGESPLVDGSWVWYPEKHAHESAAPGERFFRQRITLPADARIISAKFRLAADNEFVLYVNGQPMGDGSGWQQTVLVDFAHALRPGVNVLAIAATNGAESANPAGLIGYYEIILDKAPKLAGRIDRTWKATDTKMEQWAAVDFDDRGWNAAHEIVKFGGGPWGELDGKNLLTVSPVASDPFFGHFLLPSGWLNGNRRIVLEAEGIEPEGIAAVKINGRYRGGFIGKPYRIDITAHVRVGENAIQLDPFAPQQVRIVAY